MRVRMEEAIFENLLQVDFHQSIRYFFTVNASGLDGGIVGDLDGTDILQSQDASGCMTPHNS